MNYGNLKIKIKVYKVHQQLVIFSTFYNFSRSQNKKHAYIYFPSGCFTNLYLLLASCNKSFSILTEENILFFLGNLIRRLLEVSLGFQWRMFIYFTNCDHSGYPGHLVIFRQFGSRDPNS